MIITPSLFWRFGKRNSSLRTGRGRMPVTVLILIVLCFQSMACSALSYKFRSADCDSVQNAEASPSAAVTRVVFGMVGKGQAIRGTGWFLRPQSSQGDYSIQFDPAFSSVPKCCVETVQFSLSKLSVKVTPSVSGLRLESTHESESCQRWEKKLEYGYVVGQKCVESQTVPEPWDGHLKFICVSQ